MIHGWMMMVVVLVAVWQAAQILVCKIVLIPLHFSFQQVFHNWCNRPWYVLSCLWDGAYKRTLAVN